MEVNTERDDGILVAKAIGRIDGANANQFEGVMKDAIHPGDQAVVLDFSGITYLSSAGMRALLMISRELRSAKVGFALCSLSEPVGDVLTISGFDQILDIYETQSAACLAVKK